MLNLYITSPQKKEGKTFISAGIAATMQSLGYSTAVYKPIQTSGIEYNGFTQSTDLTFVRTIDPYINTHFSYLYKSNEEPLIAAESENDGIDIELIYREYQKIKRSSDCTIIDGDSGILSPIATNFQSCDLIKRLSIPVLMVLKPDENAINNSLLNIYALREKGIDLRGVVINSISNDCPKNLLNSITRIIEEYSDVKVLGLVPALEHPLQPEDMITAILNGIDIESAFGVKIEKLEFC